MLSKLDDLSFHQLPTTFDHPVSSDPRWYEHMVFLMTAKGGEIAMVTGNRAYLNVNVIEAFAGVVCRGKQYNVRASRAFRPNMDRMAGPLRVDVTEGLKSFHLQLEKNEVPVEFSIHWEASGSPWEEPHHFRRYNGRVLEDYMRFNQVGSFAGHVIVEGERFELSHEATFAARDHSWGIRAAIGTDSFGGSPYSWGCAHWMLFDIEGVGQGYFSLAESPEGNPLRCHGMLGARYAEKPGTVPITGYHHALNFHDGSRLLKDGRVTILLENGRAIEAEIEAISRPLNEHGCGYQKGFADGRGIGVDRGELHVEGDIWDHTDPTQVINLGPSATIPNSRLFDHVIRLNVGGKIGYAIYVLFIPGRFDPYHFAA